MSSDLQKAVDRLGRLDEFDPAEAMLQAKYQLNTWIETQEPLEGWELDPMASRIRREIRESDLLDGADGLLFSDDDVQAIQEALLLRDISRWVAQQPLDPRVTAWLDQQSELGDLEREQLAIAERLFDWTVRNIQLEETLPYPDEAVAPTAGGGASVADRIPPPQRAIPGPGYRFPPAEVVQYGYGDTLQRARVFMLLARQQGIDVVHLAFPGQTVPPRPRPWLTAVLLGRQLYLFDCELGLPIPGPEGIGIATLAQVIEQPRLLDALDIGEHDYPVSGSDLKDIIALIDASPTALSQRMKLIETNLAGEHRVILTAAPSSLAERVKSREGIASAAIWSVPYETIWFQRALRVALESNLEAARGYFAAVGIFKSHNALVRGRYLHLRGVFDDRPDKPGAKRYYMESRIPTFALADIETSKEVQRQMGLERGSQEGDFVWQARLAAAKMFAIQSKQHATYWLGLCHLETDNYPAAAAWLKERTLAADPNGPWTAGARYNLARTYEAQAEWEQAREQLLEDDSPQQHGNLLRARLLRQRAEQK